MLIAILGLILAAIPVFFFLKGKYFLKAHKIDINYDNFFVLPIIDTHNSALNKKLCFVIYGLRIINSGEQNITLKSVSLEYMIEDKKYISESIPIQIGKSKGHANVAIIIQKYTGTKILLGSWNNLSLIIGTNVLLQQNEVLNASAVFPFEGNENELEVIKNIRIIIKDYKNIRTVHKIEKQELWFEHLKKDFALINRSFEQKQGDEFIWY